MASVSWTHRSVLSFSCIIHPLLPISSKTFHPILTVYLMTRAVRYPLYRQTTSQPAEPERVRVCVSMYVISSGLAALTWLSEFVSILLVWGVVEALLTLSPLITPLPVRQTQPPYAPTANNKPPSSCVQTWLAKISVSHKGGRLHLRSSPAFLSVDWFEYDFPSDSRGARRYFVPSLSCSTEWANQTHDTGPN